MPSINYTSPRVAKGRLTNMRTGVSRVFSINPHTVHGKGGVHLAEDPIPGFSDPLLVFASGKTKVFSFQLEIDAEMTVRKLGVQVTNNNHPERDPLTFSIAGELEWYDSLTYPTDPNVGDGGLDRVLFSYGTFYNAIQVFVETADITVIEFGPDLAPTKARVDLSLKRIADENRFADSVWTGGGGFR